MIPQKFRFASLAAGIKKDGKKDFGLIVSDVPAVSAAVFTKNRVKAAPVLVCEKHLKHKHHRAIVCNSGGANAATGAQGLKDATRTVETLARELHCDPREIFVASTGVIGQLLPMEKVATAIPKLAKGLGKNEKEFCRAIMTTDAGPKWASKKITVGGTPVVVWGGAKGAGMIHPDMATMLAFVLTDANVPKPLLRSALKDAVEKSFNRATVDGDTSTNDTVIVMANGAGNAPAMKKGTASYKQFADALTAVCESLARQIVADGEGAERIAEITVANASTEKEALKVARAIAGSLLVKTALHGCDANWGRIIAAAGYSGVPLNPDRLELYFGPHCAFRNGVAVAKMERKLTAQFRKKEVKIKLLLNRGKAQASCLFCDIGREYIRINADYRT